MVRDVVCETDVMTSDLAPLPVFLGTGPLPDVELDDNLALGELMDEREQHEHDEQGVR